MTDETDDLKGTLENIREQEYPDLPADLVEHIVEIEYDSLEDRARAPKEINKIVEEYLGEDG